MPSHYRTEKPVVHVSLNPAPEDRLDDGQLAEIAGAYICLLYTSHYPGYTLVKLLADIHRFAASGIGGGVPDKKTLGLPALVRGPRGASAFLRPPLQPVRCV